MPARTIAAASSTRRMREATLLLLLAAALVASLLPTAASAQSTTVEIQLLATNDFHGRIDRNPSSSVTPIGQTASQTVGGAEFLSTHLDNRRAENPNTLYVDAGDLVGATPVLSNLFYDEPTVEIANLMGLDVQAVGNHEFDRGMSEIIRRRDGGCHPTAGCFDEGRTFEGQDFLTLGANVLDAATGQPWMQPWVIRQIGGVDVGFIGVVTKDTPTVVNPAGIEGLEFIDEAVAVNRHLPDVRAAGADVVVVLMHEGGRQDGNYNECVNPRGAAFDIINRFNPGVDVAITGHTHENYVCSNYGANNVLVTSAYQYGAMYTDIDLTVDTATGAVVSKTAVNRLVTRDVAPASDITALLAYYNALAGPFLDEVVGRSTTQILHGGSSTIRRGEAALGNLATDALVQQYPDLDFAFQNSGGLRDRLTTDLRDADGNYLIRRRDVLAVWPFGNTVWLAEVSGTQLKAILDNGVRQVGGGRFMQVSGLRVTYHTEGTDGGFPRGVIDTVEYWGHPDFEDGTPVDLSESARYRVGMNDFMALGGDGYPRIEPQVYLRDEGLDVAIERYLAAASPVGPVVEGRIAELTGVSVDGPVTIGATESTAQLTATGEYRSGADQWRLDTTRDVTEAATWASSDTSVATVDDEGLVTRRGPGTATITATYRGRSDSTTVTVVAATGDIGTQVDALEAAGRIEHQLAAQTRKAIEQAEKALAAGDHGAVAAHFQRAAKHLDQQADVAERNRNRRNDPAALRTLAALIREVQAGL